MTIKEFLCSREVTLATGSISKDQKIQFAERLAKIPAIRTIAEIGFHAGYSAECFFEHSKALEAFLSFDLAIYPYTKIAVEYFRNLHPNRFFFVEGNSLYTIPLFTKKNPELKCDLIYIDGCHAFEGVVGDILNAKQLAHPNTLLWLDDCELSSVRQAIEFCETIGAIQTRESIVSPDGEGHIWMEAKYLL